MVKYTRRKRRFRNGEIHEEKEKVECVEVSGASPYCH